MHGSLVLRLGVCFVSFMVGSLADYQQNSLLYYVFTVLNACLGFLIFFFHCTCNETVRNQFLMQLETFFGPFYFVMALENFLLEFYN